MKTEREVAQEAQEKFEFYVIGLVFTLLALSIQTAEFGKTTTKDILELVGWFSLLVCGIAGLWRLEFIPVIREKLAMVDETEGALQNLKADKARGIITVYVIESESEQPIDQRIAGHQVAYRKLKDLVAELERHNRIKYTVHRYFFVIGLLALILARAYGPIASLLISLCRHAA